MLTRYQKLINLFCTIIYLGLLIPQIAEGQFPVKSAFYNYTSQNGLTYTQVISITQGAKGEIYIVSIEGVNEYNGIELKETTSPFFSEGSLISNLVLAPDSRVLGLHSKEFIFVLNKWIKLKVQSPDSALNDINAFLFKNDLELILASDRGLHVGLYYPALDSIHLQKNIPGSDKYKKVIRLKKQTRHDNFIGLDRNLGLFTIDEKSSFKPLLPFNLKPAQYENFAITDNFLIVLYERNRVTVFDRQNLEEKFTFQFIDDELFNLVEPINESEFWLASPLTGLVKLTILPGSNNYFWRRYTKRNGLSSNFVYDMFKDRSGIFWFATNNGASKLASERFEQIDFGETALTGGFPNCWQVKNGRLYLITNPFGVAVVDKVDNTYSLKPIASGGPYNIAAYDHYIDETNRLWLFTVQGAFTQFPAFSSQPLKQVRTDHITDESMWQVFPISKQRILIGGDKHIFYVSLNGGKMKLLDKLALPGKASEVSAFHPLGNQNGAVYAGGSKFLIKIKTGKKLELTEDLSSMFKNPDFFIYDMEIDDSGRWYFGTANGGLIIKDGDKIYPILDRPDFPTHTVYDIYHRSESSFWVGSYNGLIRFSYLGNGKIKSKKFDIWDMIPPVDINYHSLKELDDGTLMYGLVNKIGIYYPDRDSVNMLNSEIEIGDVFLERKPVQDMDNLDLPYQFSNLSIKFYLPNYFNVKAFKYHYSIDPISPDWQKTLAPGQVLISTLPPGEYTLNLKISRDNDPDGEVIKHIPFRVITPFWMRWWFFMLSAILIVIAAYLVVLFRLRKIRQRQKELQQLVAERTGEISSKNQELADKNSELAMFQKTRDEFFSIVTHDLKNPINAIINMSRMIQSDYDNIPKDLEEDAKIIESASTHMLNLVTNVMDFYRLEKHDVRPNLQPLNIYPEIEKIIENYQLIAWPKKVKLSIQSKLRGDEQIMGDPHSFEQIFGNVLSNAIKFSPQKSKVEIDLFCQNSNLVVRVTDRGPGIPKHLRDKIFTEYFSTPGNENQNISGSGLGLAIAVKLTELLNGDIEAENRAESGQTGAVFTLRFKVCDTAENNQDN